jgi:hypothetical protein
VPQFFDITVLSPGKPVPISEMTPLEQASWLRPAIRPRVVELLGHTGCSYTRAGVFPGLTGAFSGETVLAEVSKIGRFMAEKRKFRSAACFH